MTKVKQENIDTMVRDFCSVVPKSKSEVRRRISSLLEVERKKGYEEGKKEILKRKNITLGLLVAFESGIKEEIIKEFRDKFNWLFDGSIVLIRGALDWNRESLNVKMTREEFEKFILYSLSSQKSSIIEELKEICDKTENEGGRLLLEEYIKSQT